MHPGLDASKRTKILSPAECRSREDSCGFESTRAPRWSDLMQPGNHLSSAVEPVAVNRSQMRPLEILGGVAGSLKLTPRKTSADQRGQTISEAPG